MLTYEDMTGLFLKAAGKLGLSTHPEHWLNSRSLEREFSCACHTGPCEDVEHQSSCMLSFAWSTLDTALSIDGPDGICDFFHESEQDCPHLHTHAIPPLVLDLSYTLPLHGAVPSDETLLNLTQLLKLRASEHSKLTIETLPGVNMVLRDGRLYPDTLTLQQRVEIPIWHPKGMQGLHDPALSGENPHTSDLDTSESRVPLSESLHPEQWLPHVMLEVCEDVVQVLSALDASVSFGASEP